MCTPTLLDLEQQVETGGQMLIYCVEDDEAVLKMEKYALQTAGYEVRGFSDAPSFQNALREALPDLILLDVMLPESSGVQILRSLRESPITAHIPVIMATARGSEMDKVESLDLGADDYLVKPFGMMEMISRVKAVLRRYVSETQSEKMAVGQLSLDLESRRVCVDGKDIELTYREFELLALLMGQPGKVFSREELLAKLWDDNYYGQTRTIDAHVTTLRRKLGQAASLIQTVRAVGYKITDPN